MLQEVVPELQAENEKLWLLIQRLLRHRYGPRSEKLDLDQLQLVLEDEEQSAAESDARQRPGRAGGETAAHRSSQPQSRCVARTPAALRGRHRHREQAMPLLWRRPAHDRRRSHRDARSSSCPAARESGVPATLWMPYLRGRGGAGTRAGAANRWR